MRRLLLSSTAIAMLLLPGVSRLGAQVVDQSNPSNSCCFGSAVAWQGQTFRPTATTVVGGGIELYAYNNTSGILTLELWDQLASNSGAVMLASGTAGFSYAAGSVATVDVFWSAVTVTPGQQYFLALNAGTGELVTTQATNTYAYGQAYYNYNSVDPTAPYTCCGSGYDLAFREYSSSVVATPEPAGVALLATGLVGIAGVVRRKRNK